MSDKAAKRSNHIQPGTNLGHLPRPIQGTERTRNMKRFDFSDEEISMMRGIPETYLHDLTAEISSAEKLSFREDLKREKDFIPHMLGRMEKKAA